MLGRGGSSSRCSHTVTDGLLGVELALGLGGKGRACGLRGSENLGLGCHGPSSLLGVGSGLRTNEGLLGEPDGVGLVGTGGGVDPDGLGALEGPGVLWGLGPDLGHPSGCDWGALRPLLPDYVWPVAHTRLRVEVEVAA